MAKSRFWRIMRQWLQGLLLIGLFFPMAAKAAEYQVINPSSYEKMLGYLLINRDDVSRYKKIFRAVEKADFEEADELIGELDNHILLGTVLAEKYLHPKYQSSFDELQNWLKQYRDYPAAGRIYRLALRKGRGQMKPPEPSGSFLADRKMDDATRKYLQKQVNRFRTYIRQGKTKRARLVLEQPKVRRYLPDAYWDDLAATLALKYFVDGYDTLAWQWGTKAARRRTSGTAAWVAGLSAWRQKQYKNASVYFERLAKSGNSDEWLVSAGGYWAARAYERRGLKAKADEMLRLSSRYKHTFYGILAAFRLGETLNYNWESIAYFNDFNNFDYVYELLASPNIRRAVILLQAKQPKLAEAELRHGYAEMNDKQKEAVVFIANQYKLHALAIYASNQSKDVEQNRSYDGIAYPVPSWFPRRGWKVDKALVLGLVRQESSFRPEAESAAGACGLMQLMPGTAYYITKDADIKKDKNRLKRTDYNLELGQQYVSYLLDKPYIDGNLFYLMTAYNAGPGNLLKWQKSTRYNDDALLFIEAVPSAETRIYIERVMANYWIYNMRFNLPNPTLKQTADGEWPHLPR